ncbi:MAG: energy transducer TonB [Alistipes sp.]|uniref:energy transducer TonB n=1 Tax=Alistipes sp. TaxID=1872444 RepID=UPI003992273F
MPLSSIILKGQEDKSSYKNQEAYLDSLWRKEIIWNLGVAKITGEPIKDLSTIEAPKWAKWNYDLEEYFVSQMKYPAHLLRKNQAGYSVAMFSLDTLGLPRRINILTSIHKDFDKEVIRLIRDLPHCLPCRDKNGKRIECLYTVYVPFLPQRYRDRIITDSIAEEELKHCFVEWEEQASLQDGNPHAVQNYIYSKLRHNSDLLYKRQKQVRGVYSISIDSYGEVTGTKTLQSCGIQEWDSQVEKIIKGMPRWTPTINHYGKGEYQRSLYTVSVWLKNRNSHTMMRILP